MSETQDVQSAETNAYSTGLDRANRQASYSWQSNVECDEASFLTWHLHDLRDKTEARL